MEIGILEPEGFSIEAKAHLSRLGTVSDYDGTSLSVFLSKLSVLFVRLAHQIDGDFIRQAPNLRYICSPTTSHTHLCEGALAARGIKIVSLRGEREFLETIRATPEHTFGLILALLRHYKFALTHVDAGNWNRDLLKGEELFGKTVGIVGLGRVGSCVAKYCLAFGAKVAYFDINPNAGASIDALRCSSIKEAIEHSDIVLLSASYANDSSPIVGPQEIVALSGKFFVNTARGELVDEEELLRAIFENRLAGVAVDVIANENGSNRLEQWRVAAQQNNVIVTPHMAGATRGSMERTECFIALKLCEMLKANE